MMRIRSLPGTLVLAAGVVATGAFAPVPGLAAESLKLQLQIGSTCVSGVKPHAGEPITVRLLRADGTTRQTRTDDSGTPDWNVCFGHALAIGSKLKMTNVETSRTVIVPDLTVVVDRVHDVVSGHGPAGGSIAIRYHECYPAGCAVPQDFATHASSHSRYHRDLSASVDIDGSDEIDVRYQNSFLDGFSRSTFAPHMEITKPNRIDVSCLPRGTTIVRLLSSTGALRASKTFTATSECGGAAGSFRKNGHAVNVHTGDRITSDLAADASFTWPAMSVTGVATDLSGHCFKDSDFVVFMHIGNVGSTANGTTDGHGDFHTTLFTPLSPGDSLDLVCESGPGDTARIARTL